MKTVYIPAKSEVDIATVLEKVDFKGKLGVVTTVQHLDEVNKIKKEGWVVAGQVLGCNVKNALDLDVDAYLYVGSGKFHAIQVARKTGKRVFLANPFTNSVTELDMKDVEKIEKRIKGAYLKYLHSKKVGVLVSVKKWQNYMQGKDFDFGDKEVYYFGYMCDALTVAIIRDSIEAVKHLNSLEEVDVNDKTGDGIPKIFFAKSLKMLKELVDNQKADVSAKTKSGLSFIDFLITKADFNAFSYGKNVDLDNIIKYSMVNYLNNLGVSYNNTTKKLLEENNVLEKKVDKEKLLREVLEEVKKEE